MNQLQRSFSRCPFMESLSDYISACRKTFFQYGCHIYCTAEGLRSFFETGFLDELPDEIAQPFSIEDRRILLIQEPGLIEDFYDYLSTLPDSYTYSPKETCGILKELLSKFS